MNIHSGDYNGYIVRKLLVQIIFVQLGILVFNTVICTYKAHETAPLEGVAITQWRGKNLREAASDYRRVVDELMHDWRK
jgi:chromosome partitioning protein